MKKILFGSLAVLMLGSIAIKADASTLTLYAFQDAEIRNGAGANYGASPFLSGNVSSSSKDSFGLFQFDLSALVPAGATIDSADVSLYRNLSNDNSSFNNPISLYGLHSAWQEGTVTGNSEPADNMPAVASLAAPGTTGGYLTWSGAGLTSLVQNWVSNAGTNFGLGTSDLNYASGEDTRFVQFYSAEAAVPQGVAAVAPRLTITYSASVGGNGVTATPEAGTLILLTIGVAGLGLWRWKRFGM